MLENSKSEIKNLALKLEESTFKNVQIEELRRNLEMQLSEMKEKLSIELGLREIEKTTLAATDDKVSKLEQSLLEAQKSIKDYELRLLESERATAEKERLLESAESTRKQMAEQTAK